MTTIKDIAKLANVSRATVSRVLNNTGNVDPNIKVKVQKVIDETGYVPSQFAKSLRTKQTKIIGIITPRMTTETVNRFLDIFAKNIQEYDYQTIIYNTGLNKEKEKEAFSILFSRRVDGLVYFATNVNEEVKKIITTATIPVVIVGQNFDLDNQIIENNHTASTLLVEEMIQRGYQNFGFIGVPESDYSVGVVRKMAFLETLEKYHMNIDKDLIAIANFDYKTGYDAMSHILEKNKPMDAVVAVTDRIAIGAMQCIHDHGLKVPKDIAIAGMGATAISFYASPRLTTIDFKNEEQGELAVNMLMQLINSKNQKHSKTKIIEPNIIIGESI